VRAAALVLGVLAFLAVSALLARWLSTENAERDKVEALLAAQARGDAAGMLRELDGCDGGCAAQVRANAQRLRRAGDVQIVAYESGTSHSLTGDTAPTRVVWRTPDTLTVVQCVGVRRTGNPVSGLDVDLLDLGAPIRRTASC
jgi:hypothetical protein